LRDQRKQIQRFLSSTPVEHAVLPSTRRLISSPAHAALQGPRAFMTFISEHSISMGKYVVSPTTHPADNGGFRASVAIKSGHGSASHHRVFRLEGLFPTREVARLLAVTHGWLTTGNLQPHAC
jgi:hypothetical protein